MRNKYLAIGSVLMAMAVALPTFGTGQAKSEPVEVDGSLKAAIGLIKQGKQTFRYDTFGNEAFWGDTIRLHEAIAGKANGGVGRGVSPKTALSLGLKVDAAALPASLVELIKQGKVDLDDPATTLALLKLNAVVGVKGIFDAKGKIKSMGITCALCHSTVDDSFAPGIGSRLDGWAAGDLNVGAIIAAAPDLSVLANLLKTDQKTIRTVLNSWGPGKFDAVLTFDGKPFRPDGKTGATLIPPAFGLAGVNLATYNGWGGVAHWNALVGILKMSGKGRFYDPRLKDAKKFPVAAANGFDNIKVAPENDQLTPKLPGLHVYQLSIAAPKAPKGSFDTAMAAKGKVLFNGKAQCSTCHVPPIFTEPGHNLHTPEEIGIDAFQAERSPTGGYRTTPLAGLWSHAKGGYYHDGRFATMADVVKHYDSFFKLKLADDEKKQFVEYMKSL